MEAMQSSPYKVTKRQVLQVNIRKSCSDIVDYVYARHRDKRGKRTRFSLYLSAHLMYGAISIWRKQVNILFAEAQEVKLRVWAEMPTIMAINMKNAGTHDQVTLPEAMPRAGMEDPFFGSFKTFMDEQFEIPSTSSFGLPDHESLGNVLGSPNTVSSKDDITIKELISSPMKEIEIPGEAELPELNAKELNLISPNFEDVELRELQDQDKKPSLVEEEKTPEKATKPAEGREKGAKRKRKQKTDDMDQTQLDHAPSPPKRFSPLQELLPTEEPVRRRHRRELFVDDMIKMDKVELRFNLSTSETTCRHLVIPSPKSLNPAQLFKRPGSKDLATVCNPALRRLWERNCKTDVNVATDTELYVLAPFWIMPESDLEGTGSGGDRSIGEGSSQDERRQYVASVMDPLDDIRMDVDVKEEAVAEEPSVEQVRKGSPSLSTSQHSSLHLPLGQSPLNEASLSRSRSRRSRSQQGSGTDEELSVGRHDKSASLAGESVPVDMSAQLDVLPEEMEEQFSPPFASVYEEISALKMFSPEKRFIRRCESECGEETWTTFKRMCPLVMKRPQAAKCFMTLLDEKCREKLTLAETRYDENVTIKDCFLPEVQCKDGSMFARQFRPFADIYISISEDNLPFSSP